MLRGRDSKSRRRVKQELAEMYWQSLVLSNDETDTHEPPDEADGWDVIDAILRDIRELIEA